MRKIINFKKKSYFLSSAAVGGREEGEGPLGKYFDITDRTDLFGKNTWEKAEGEIGRMALATALKKGNISPEEIDVLLAGDLENQCVASSSGLYSFGIPYVGLYSACSTCTEALVLGASLISDGCIDRAATVTTSHNSAAERQFRTPIEYGAQRTPTAQWTATAGGAFILTADKSEAPYIDRAMIGKIVDGLTRDGSNMGAAMSRAAFDSIYTFLNLSQTEPKDYDAIITGDLGKVGSDILCELLKNEGIDISDVHIDCGKLLYDMNKNNVKSGASGCGCSASVLAAYILPKLRNGQMKNILFLSTGALMSPSSVMQGESILGIAPVINIKACEK